MAGTITKLEIQKRHKQRVNVYLDNQFAFAVTLNEALSLKKGQFLNDVEIDQLKRQDSRHKAYERALHYLGFRARSTAEMERYLEQKGFIADVIADTVARLLSEGYLDDHAFAVTWTNNRQTLKPKSRRALHYELRQKGIDREIIEQVVDSVDEKKAAAQALESRVRRWQDLDKNSFNKKAMSFLNRRGFSYEITRVTVQQAWDDLQQEKGSEDTENTGRE
jgi:regulatory protein